jgi:hypothetical protein
MNGSKKKGGGVNNQIIQCKGYTTHLHLPAHFAHDMFLMDPHLTVIIQTTIIAIVVIPFCQEILFSSFSTFFNSKQKKERMSE